MAMQPLTAIWRHGLSIVNLRGSSGDAGFVEGAAQALGLALPLQPCSSHARGQATYGANSARGAHSAHIAQSPGGVGSSAPGTQVERIVCAGPDEWFVVAAAGCAGTIQDALRASLAATHHAATDVSSGYSVLHLSGAPVRDVLAQGCPLDLHPRAFGIGRSAGSHFFKASVQLWQTDAAPRYELLVRRSFTGYVQLMLERCTLECGLACNPATADS